MSFKKTEQQLNVIELSKKQRLIKVNAGAGASKTTTCVFLSEEEENKVPTLYLAFNKSMATEAQGKFGRHVTCRTTHSLAYQVHGKGLSHKLSRPKDKYVNMAGTAQEITKFYKLKPYQVGEDEYVGTTPISQLILETVKRYEQSGDMKLSKKHIPLQLQKDLHKKHPSMNQRHFADMVFKHAKKLWEDRINPDSVVMCSHDTYLKLYQLGKPDLSSKYQIIILDECQDTSDCVLDIFLNQKKSCKLIMVGDEFQAIYGWRGAVNAMDKVQGFKQAVLSKSFRFGEEVADIANVVLDGAFRIEGFEEVNSVTSHNEDIIDKSFPYTMLYRTNAELIMDGLDLLSEGKDVNIDIDVYDFTNMLRSAEALRANDMKKVKHADLLSFENWDEFIAETEFNGAFKRVARMVESNQVGRVCAILKGYRKDPDAHIQMITAHRSKGLEWDQVVLGNDFPSIYDEKGKYVGLQEAERNLLYVAVTRAQKYLCYNNTVREMLEREELEGVAVPEFDRHEDFDDYEENEARDLAKAHGISYTGFEGVEEGFNRVIANEVRSLTKDIKFK